MENFIIGISSGIVASVLFWYLITKCFVPKIECSEKIGKIPDNAPSLFKYRFKFYNRGWRDVIDIEVLVLFRVQGLKNDRPTNWDIFHLPVFHNKVPLIKCKSNRAFTLQLYKALDFDVSYVPKSIKDKLHDKTLTLEDLFDLGKNPTMQVFIFGFDSFSGSRKLYQSKLYHKSDIIFGYFSKGSLDIIPIQENTNFESQEEIEN